MQQKQIAAVVVIIVVAAVAGFLFYKPAEKPAAKPATQELSLTGVPSNALFGATDTPERIGRATQTNPFAGVNPFAYENPFE